MRFQLNFLPGSNFLSGEISECPKTQSALILYLFFIFLHKNTREDICFLEKGI